MFFEGASKREKLNEKVQIAIQWSEIFIWCYPRTWCPTLHLLSKGLFFLTDADTDLLRENNTFMAG
jgi:hypothetical protein